MADTEDKAVNRYLQEAQNRGGGWGMAMRMMARRILVLEDRLLRAGVDFPDAPGVKSAIIPEASAPRSAPPPKPSR